MKKIFMNICFVLVLSSLTMAQSLLLNIDGETPDPTFDKTGKNTVTINGNVTANGGVLLFPSGTDYLVIQTFTSSFDINKPWTFETKVNLSDSTDELCFIDFRSTSTTGHLYFYYNRDGRGLFFSDRALNGGTGALVFDQLKLPSNQQVSLKLEFTGTAFKIYRNGILTADSAFTGILSSLAKTTIGYSEDRRAAHHSFTLDDVKLTGSGTTSVAPDKALALEIYPNPTFNNINITGITAKTFIALYDLVGNLILQQEVENNTVLNTGNLIPGIYMLLAKSNNRNICYKVIVNK